jgi:hypothetical protein
LSYVYQTNGAIGCVSKVGERSSMDARMQKLVAGVEERIDLEGGKAFVVSVMGQTGGPGRGDSGGWCSGWARSARKPSSSKPRVSPPGVGSAGGADRLQDSAVGPIQERRSSRVRSVRSCPLRWARSTSWAASSTRRVLAASVAAARGRRMLTASLRPRSAARSGQVSSRWEAKMCGRGWVWVRECAKVSQCFTGCSADPRVG